MSVGIITVFAVIIISLLITRVATIYLTLTGLSREIARFQARSALTGAGFATTESEKLMTHPLRRRMLMFLMLVGNAGIIAVIASTVLIFINPAEQTATSYLMYIIVGLGIILLLTKNSTVDKVLNRIITHTLKRWTDVEVSDTANLIYLGADYQVSELKVNPDDWLAGKTIKELNLSEEGVLILGIQKYNGEYIGIPHPDTKIKPNTNLLIYGRMKSIKSLDIRKSGFSGDFDHNKAVYNQREIESKQIQDDFHK